MKLFTCTLTSPAQLVLAATKAKIYPDNRIFTLPVNQLLKSPEIKEKARGASVILVLTYEDFVRNLGMLNRWSKDVIVFCSALQAARFSAANHTDALIDPKNPSTSYRFIPFKPGALRDGTDTPDVTINEEYLHQYIESVREGSVLNALMTVIYSLGSASDQKRIREAIIRWFVEGDGDRQLLVQIIKKEVKRFDAHAPLVKICTGNENFLKAFAEVNRYKKADKQPNYTSIAKKFPDLDMYDIRYMINVHGKINYSRDIAGKTLSQIYWARDRNSAKLKTSAPVIARPKTKLGGRK